MSDQGSWNTLLSHPASGAECEISGEGGTSAGQNSRCTERASLSGENPSGFPKRTHGALPYPDSLKEKHTALAIITPRTIAYPIRICCPDHWLKWAILATSFRQLATAHIPLSSDGVSGCPVWTSLPWIPKNSPKSRIALVIKKLSKHQNLTQFD